MSFADLLCSFGLATEREAAAVSRRMAGAVRREVLAGRRVDWPALGVFVKRRRVARTLRSVHSGELMRIDGEVRVGFRPAKQSRRAA